MKRVIIVFFIALLFCNEEEIYTFVNNINEGHRVKYKQDDIMTFEMPGAGEVKQGGNKTQLLEYLGKQGEFFLIRSTLSKIIAINVMGDKVSSNYDSQIINNIPCLLYIDINGEVDHLESEEEYMEDIFKEKYMGITPKNYIYPFGKNAVDLSKGDSWTEVNDSVTIFFDEVGRASRNAVKVGPNQRVLFNLMSNDVIHSFNIPATRITTEFAPGEIRSIWIRTPPEPGKYLIQCLNYCGLGHSQMKAWLVVAESDPEEDHHSGEAAEAHG